MDMNLCADCGGSGMDAMTFTLGAGGMLICFALGGGLALLAGDLSRAANLSRVTAASVGALLLVIAVAALEVRPAFVFPFSFLLGEGLAVHRMYRKA
jgi:hypothetical protein